jgi:tetratricopeptide (TPR) repeat protein
MKTTFISLIFLVFITTAHSQSHYYDSARAYSQKNISVAIAYADSALTVAHEDVDVAKAHYMLGYLYRRTKQYLLSIDHYKSSMLLYRDLDQKQFMYLQLNQGINFEEIASFELASYYYSKAIGLAIELEDADQLAKGYRQKARVYRKMNKLDSAIVLNMRAIDYYKSTKKKKYISAIQNEVGLVFLKLDSADRAIEYFYAAEREVDLEQPNNLRSARTNYYVGKAYLKLKDTITAVHHFNKSMLFFGGAVPEDNYVDLLFDYASLDKLPTEMYTRVISYAEANNLTRTRSYRDAILITAKSGDIDYMTKYGMVVEELISEKDAALALHKEQFGKDYNEQLEAKILLAGALDKFVLWQFLMFTLLGLTSIVGLYVFYRKKMRAKVRRNLVAQMASMQQTEGS